MVLRSQDRIGKFTDLLLGSVPAAESENSPGRHGAAKLHDSNGANSSKNGLLKKIMVMTIDEVLNHRLLYMSHRAKRCYLCDRAVLSILSNSNKAPQQTRMNL